MLWVRQKARVPKGRLFHGDAFFVNLAVGQLRVPQTIDRLRPAARITGFQQMGLLWRCARHEGNRYRFRCDQEGILIHGFGLGVNLWDGGLRHELLDSMKRGLEPGEIRCS